MNVDERRWDGSNIRVDTQRSAQDTWPEYADRASLLGEYVIAAWVPFVRDCGMRIEIISIYITKYQMFISWQIQFKSTLR